MILEILDGLGNLAGAEFLPLRAFWPFFAKYLPLEVERSTGGLKTDYSLDNPPYVLSDQLIQ